MCPREIFLFFFVMLTSFCASCFHLSMLNRAHLWCPSLFPTTHAKWLAYFFELSKSRFWISCWVCFVTKYFEGTQLAFIFIRTRGFVLVHDRHHALWRVCPILIVLLGICLLVARAFFYQVSISCRMGLSLLIYLV